MSIIDNALRMCDDTALGTSIAAAALKGSYIDLGAMRDYYDNALTPDVNEGGNLWWNVKVSTAITTAGSPVVTIALYDHTAAGVASGSALVTADTITAAQSAGYTVIRTKIPAGTVNRYVGTVVTIASAALTAGSIDSWISLDSETPKPMGA